MWCRSRRWPALQLIFFFGWWYEVENWWAQKAGTAETKTWSLRRVAAVPNRLHLKCATRPTRQHLNHANNIRSGAGHLILGTAHGLARARLAAARYPAWAAAVRHVGACQPLCRVTSGCDRDCILRPTLTSGPIPGLTRGPSWCRLGRGPAGRRSAVTVKVIWSHSG